MPTLRTPVASWLPRMVVTFAIATQGAFAWAGVDWSISSSPDGQGVVLSKKGGVLTIHVQPVQTHSGSKGIAGATLTLAEGIGHDEFTGQNYQLDLTLTDLTSAASSVLRFTGSISGVITNGVPSWQHHVIGPASYADLPLGENLYTVRIGNFLGPDAPGTPGSIGLLVSVSGQEASEPETPTHATPEPGTLMLTLSAALLIGLRGWRQAG